MGEAWTVVRASCFCCESGRLAPPTPLWWVGSSLGLKMPARGSVVGSRIPVAEMCVK